MNMLRCTSRALAAVVAAAIGLTFTCPVQAVEGQSKDRALKVKSEKSEMAFPVSADATIVAQDEKAVSLGDLKVGEQVRVDYAEENGVMVAQHITVKEK